MGHNLSISLAIISVCIFLISCEKKMILDTTGGSEYQHYNYNRESERVQLTPSNSFTVRDDVQVETNYKPNYVISAYVGEPVIKRKTYKVKIQSQLMASPMVDTEMNDGKNRIILEKGGQYPVRFTTVREGVVHYILEFLHPQNGRIYGILFDNNGAIYRKVLEGDTELPGIFNIRPINSIMTASYIDKVISRENIENYEIIFSGTNNNQINMSYREYTSGDVARTAYFQNLTYPANSEYIRYKGIKVKIHKVDSEKISYEVVEE